VFSVHHELFVSRGFALFFRVTKRLYCFQLLETLSPSLKHAQESLCADSASFDLPSVLLSACISEAQECVQLAAARRDSLNDVSINPENFAILKGQTLGLD